LVLLELTHNGLPSKCFYCGEFEDQNVLEEHAQHSEGSIFHPLPLYAGLGASFLKDKLI
jgi:hypothetical protein